MSSPRKFRVWDGEEMYEPPHPFLLGADGKLYRCSYQIENAEHEVGGTALFSTGLTDAEGAEIWEGDILGFPNQDEPMLVIWDGGMQAFRGQCPPDELSGTTWPLWEQVGDKGQAAVIGNRYENPELLDETG